MDVERVAGAATLAQLGGAASATSVPYVGTQADADVGIGATPLARFHVKEATRAEVARFEGNGQGQNFFYDGATNRGRIGFGAVGNIFSNLLANAIGIRSEAALQLGVGSSVAVTIREVGYGPGTGYVGFGGKTDPASQVELGGEASPELSITSATAVTGKRYGIASWTDGSFYIIDRTAAVNVLRIAPTTKAVTLYGPLDIGSAAFTAGAATITSGVHNAFGVYDSSGGSGLAATQFTCQSAAGGAGAGIRFLSQETGTSGFLPQAVIEAEGESNWSSVAAASSFLRFATSNAGTLVEALRITAKQNVLLAKGAPGTGATDGYPYIPSDAGAPTGVPTANAGFAAMKYDTTNHKLWVYDGGWKGVVVA